MTSTALRAALLIAAGACAAPALGASPEVTIVVPRGLPRGGKATLTFYGKRLDDADGLLCYSDAIVQDGPIKVIQHTQVEVPVRIAEDAPLGEMSLRMRCRTGISELRTVWIEDRPAIDEVEPNNQPAEAQTIPLDSIISGRIQSEDVDRFRFEGAAGERVRIEVIALRLGSQMFDCALTVRDARGFTVAESDDSPLGRQDPMCALELPADGAYTIELRESAYRGNDLSLYRLHVGRFLRPTACWPPGGPAGAATPVELLGDIAGITTATVAVPTGFAEPSFPVFPRNEAGVAPSPVPFRVSSHPNVLELEPNNGFNQAAKALEGQAAPTAPVAFNGIIATERDLDSFALTLKKGEQVFVRGFAWQLGSPLDPVVTLHDEKGRYKAGNDDKVGPDSDFNWRADADGMYFIRVRDHLFRGGPTFVYRVEVSHADRAMSLRIPKFGRYGQDRQDIPVPAGNRVAALIQVDRESFRGDVAVIASNLPAGVALHAPTCSGAVNQIPVVFEAAAGAEREGRRLRLLGRFEDKGGAVLGEVRQPSELVYGAPNNQLYWERHEDRLAFAVTDAAPFSVTIVQPKAPLVLNGHTQLQVQATRQEGFNEDIRIQVLWNPPGVGSSNSAKIPKGQLIGHIPMNANNRAGPGRWPLVVVAWARVGRGNVWVSSQLAELEVSKPYLDLDFTRAAVEQGAVAEIVCELKPGVGFEGAAEARLIGLPQGTKAEALRFEPGAERLVFRVETAPDARPGRYKNIVGEVVCKTAGEPVIHRCGNTELRIDVPLKPAPAKPAAAKPEPPKPPPPPKAAPAKPLTRLEKLRLEHAKRRAAAAEARP